MNLFHRLFRPGRSITDRVADLMDEAPSAALVEAIGPAADALPDALLGKDLKGLRPQLVLVFARQAADGASRLASGYWTSDRGRNVGHDVLQAQAAALAVFRQVLGAGPGVHDPLLVAVDALDQLIDRHRGQPGDEDGYGLGTLHEIRRDLARLAHGEA